MNKFKLILGSVCLLILSKSVLSKEKIQFGGFAYLGDHAFISQNYPYTESINNLQQGALDKQLWQLLQSDEFQHFDLEFNQLSDLDSGAGLAVAFALERESVSLEKIGDDYKLLISLSAQALFFDFVDKNLVAAYPIRVQFIDVLQEKPSKEYIAAKVAQLYFGTSEVNIFEKFSETLNSKNIKKKYNGRMQVTAVVIEDKAVSKLPEKYVKNQNNLKNFMAQSFTQFLSSNQDVSMLPYTKGHAVGNKMAGRFANGEVFDIKLPEPDYNIEITLRGFKKVKFSGSNVGSAWIYGSYIGLKVYEPLSGKVYIDHKIKNGATKKVPSSQSLVDDWPSYVESLFGLFDSLTKELDKPTKEWAKKHIGTKEAIKQLKAFKKVVEQCK